MRYLSIIVLLAMSGVAPAGPLQGDRSARAAALGGAASAGAGALAGLDADPAQLADAAAPQAAARYQSLYTGLAEDMGRGRLAALAPLGPGVAGLAWSHFGAAFMREDRLRLAWGMDALPDGLASLGVQADWLSRAYSPGALAGVGGGWSAQALDLGLGVQGRPLAWLCLGASAENLTRPNLGVLSEDRLERVVRLGAQAWVPTQAGPLLLQAQQRFEGDRGVPGGGLEWRPAVWGLALRAGMDADEAGAGFGVELGALSLDYAYQWGWREEARDFAGSHAVELAWRFGERADRRPWEAGRAVEERLGRARKALARGDWYAAAGEAGQVLAADPANAEAVRLLEAARQGRSAARGRELASLGARAEREGQAVRAQGLYEQALVEDAGNTEARHGLDRLKAQAPASALADARVARLMEQAAGLMAQTRTAEALAALDQALALYPEDATLKSLRQAWEPPAATQPAPAPAAAEPGVPAEARRLVQEAEALRQRGREDLAAEAERKALQLAPNSAAVRRLVRGAGEPGGEQALRKARSAALYEEGLQAYAAGERARALRLWEEALRLDPANLKALNSLARARMEDKE